MEYPISEMFKCCSLDNLCLLIISVIGTTLESHISPYEAHCVSGIVVSLCLYASLHPIEVSPAHLGSSSSVTCKAWLAIESERKQKELQGCPGNVLLLLNLLDGSGNAFFTKAFILQGNRETRI